MVSIEDVRARVQAAAERQIQQRTDAAAEVAEAVQDVTQKQTALGGAQQVLDEAMRAALAVMSLDELAEFTGLQKNYLPVPTGGRKASVRAAGLRRRGPAAGRPTAVPPANASASASNAAGSDGSDAA